MKRKLLLTALIALFVSNILKVNASDDDTTKVFDSGNKRIVVTENVEKQRIDVEVLEKKEGDEYQPYEKIFEGHYRDGESREQRKYLMSIDIPSPMTKRKFESDYRRNNASFGIGFAGFTEQGDYNDIPFRNGSSPEISLTLYNKSLSLSRNRQWSIVTGLGIRWVRYHLKGNHYFDEKDDYTQLFIASNDLKFKKSKLGITTLNIPLLLEWKNRHLFFSAGGVCSFKTASSSRIEYVDKSGKKRAEKVASGMTLRPVTFDILVQAGTRDVGLFTRYSPVSLFEKNKGPVLYPLTFGFLVYLD